MIKIEMKYQRRTKIISAVYVDIKQENGIFDIYILDAVGGEHRESSTNEKLKTIDVIDVDGNYYDIREVRGEV